MYSFTCDDDKLLNKLCLSKIISPKEKTCFFYVHIDRVLFAQTTNCTQFYMFKNTARYRWWMTYKVKSEQACMFYCVKKK